MTEYAVHLADLAVLPAVYPLRPGERMKKKKYTAKVITSDGLTTVELTAENEDEAWRVAETVGTVLMLATTEDLSVVD